MITKEHAQEGLSRAYIQAISAAARVNLRMEGEFDYGFDGTFRLVVSRPPFGDDVTRNHPVNDGYPIDFQLKCSWKWSETENDIKWSIKSKTYNDLLYRNSGPGSTKAILVLMCLPTEESSWLHHNEEGLLLRKCCYFFKVDGEPIRNENSTKKLTIPKANILNPTTLRKTLEEYKAGIQGMFEDAS